MRKIWLSIAILVTLSAPLSTEAAVTKMVATKPVAKVKVVKPVNQIYINKEYGFTLRYPAAWQAYRDAEIEDTDGQTADLITASTGNIHAAVVENFNLGDLPAVTDLTVVIAGGEADYFPRQLKYAPDPEYPDTVESLSRSLLFQNYYSAALRWIGQGIPGDAEGRWVGYTVVSTGLRYAASGHRAVRIVALVPSGPDQVKQLKALDTMVKSIQFIAPSRLKNQKLPDAPMPAPVNPNVLP